MALGHQLHTIAEIATLLDLHRKTVELMIRRGDLGHVRIGRRVYVRDDQFAEFIDAHTIDPD